MVRCTISVHEPWELSGTKIKGSIFKIVSKDCILFKTDSPLTVDNISGDVIVLSSRHEGSDFEIENTYSWAIGGGLMLTASYENLDKMQLQEKSKYSIIGELVRDI